MKIIFCIYQNQEMDKLKKMTSIGEVSNIDLNAEFIPGYIIPYGLAVTKTGNVIFADFENNKIRSAVINAKLMNKIYQDFNRLATESNILQTSVVINSRYFQINREIASVRCRALIKLTYEL